MAVSNLRHTEGKDFYVINMPHPLTRKMLGVRFWQGQGRTRHQRKAERFDMEFDYEVLLPQGVKKAPWTPAVGTYGEREDYETEEQFRQEFEDEESFGDESEADGESE